MSYAPQFSSILMSGPQLVDWDYLDSLDDCAGRCGRRECLVQWETLRRQSEGEIDVEVSQVPLSF